ncbi:MAG: flippase [Ktedonobacteraceae bacterium]|nr:flippase [Ktedonobacteraceae bacterium]
MNRLRRIVGNTVISLFGQGITWTSTLLLTIAYGRFLGDVKFGELYFAITFVMLVGFPLEFGFNQQLTRDVAQEPTRSLHYLASILSIKFVLWIILYSCILLACWLLGYSAEVRLLVIICGITLLSGSIANTFGAAHYAFERVTFPVVGTILEKGLSALVGWLVLRAGAGVQIMACVLLGGSLINALWQGLWILRQVGIPIHIDLALVRRLLHTSIPFLLYGMLGVIYYRIDTILLSLMQNEAVVGWYGAGYRLFDTLVFLPSLVISAIMYPVFSKLSVHAESELKVAIEKSMNFLLFCGFPITTILIVAAPQIIGFLYHRTEFLPAIPVIQSLAPGLLFLYVNSVLTSTMMSIKRERRITIMAAIALVVNLGLNLFLIPLYRHVGAAIVTSLTELLLTCLACIFIPRSLLPRGSLMVGLKALITSLVMASVIWIMRQFSIFAILPVAMATYLVVAAVLGTIPRDDLKALYASIRHKGQRSSQIPDTAKQIQTSSEVALLMEEDTEPTIESVLVWRGEWTDPSLLALRHRRHSRELRLQSVAEEKTIPLEALDGQSSPQSPVLPATPTLKDEKLLAEQHNQIKSETEEKTVSLKALNTRIRPQLLPDTPVPFSEPYIAQIDTEGAVE